MDEHMLISANMDYTNDYCLCHCWTLPQLVFDNKRGGTGCLTAFPRAKGSVSCINTTTLSDYVVQEENVLNLNTLFGG